MPAPPVGADERRERYADETPRGVFCARLDYSEVTGGEAHEWNHIALLRNLNTMASRSENCAMYAQARRHSDGSTWGGCIEACDESFGAAYGPQVGLEVDNWCNGADPYKWRLGIHIVVGDAQRIRTGVAGGQPCEAAYGILMSNNYVDHGAKFGVGIKLKHFMDAAIAIDGEEDGGPPSHYVARCKGSFLAGLSFVDATLSGSAIRLGRGQTIAFEGTDGVTVGLFGERIELRLLGVPFAAFDYNTGDLFLKGAVKPL